MTREDEILQKIKDTDSEIYARAIVILFSGLYDDLTVLQVREKLHEEFVEGKRP